MAAKPKQPNRRLMYLIQEVANEMADDEAHGAEWRPKLQHAMDIVIAGGVDTVARVVRHEKIPYQYDLEQGCTCADGVHRGFWCRHMTAVEMQSRVDSKLRGGPDIMPAMESEEVNNLFGDPPPEKPKPEASPVAPVPESPYVEHPSTLRTEGYQYADYASTLFIQRTLRKTKLGWTFRGDSDEDVWQRAAAMIRMLDRFDPETRGGKTET